MWIFYVDSFQSHKVTLPKLKHFLKINPSFGMENEQGSYTKWCALQGQV